MIYQKKSEKKVKFFFFKMKSVNKILIQFFCKKISKKVQKTSILRVKWVFFRQFWICVKNYCF